ncbi:hypothetical protein B9T50_08540 [Zymomonas mobilis subsp. mobilis]|nr:hypothetical protein B9T50_08540 [Zymomonas mobilis subsp. mobilis]
MEKTVFNLSYWRVQEKYFWQPQAFTASISGRVRFLKRIQKNIHSGRMDIFYLITTNQAGLEWFGTEIEGICHLSKEERWHPFP